ncbi:MAG: hypothetical protein V3573_02360 [Desulfovibrionaceae bacterium]
MDWNDVIGFAVVLGLGAFFALCKHLNDKDRGEEAPFGCGCSGETDPDDPASACKGCPVARNASDRTQCGVPKKD